MVGGQRTTIDLVAGNKTSGEPVVEEVLVTREGGARYRVEATPGLVLGVARGDVIEVDSQARTFVVRERGGNLAVHVYGPSSVAEQAIERVQALGGSLDGRAPNLTVYTVPVAAGFSTVEALFDELVAADQRIEWYFGNVYDPTDGVTPLRWWE